MRRTATTVMALGLLLLVACSGSEKGSSPPPSNVPTTATASVSPETSSPAVTASSWKSFQLPSRNIGCSYFRSELRCDILSGLQPEPSGECMLDWTGIAIGGTGQPRPVCAGDTAYDMKAEVLEYGQAWSRGGISCESKTSGLICRNDSAHEFMLSREDWSLESSSEE